MARLLPLSLKNEDVLLRFLVRLLHQHVLLLRAGGLCLHMHGDRAMLFLLLMGPGQFMTHFCCLLILLLAADCDNFLQLPLMAVQLCVRNLLYLA